MIQNALNTNKSTHRLSQELAKLGCSASSRLMGVLLRAMNYSLQGNRKILEGKQHPVRNAQSEYINARVVKDHVHERYGGRIDGVVNPMQ